MAKPNLQKREWVAILIGVVVLTAIGVTPLIQKAAKAYDRSSRQVVQARARLDEVRQLRVAIEDERSGQRQIEERLAARAPGFNLWNFTNQCLRKTEIETMANVVRKRISGKIDGVQMTLKGVRMSELIDLLHLVYDSNNLIVVQKLDHLRPSRSGTGLDCQITFMTPSGKAGKPPGNSR